MFKKRTFTHELRRIFPATALLLLAVAAIWGFQSCDRDGDGKSKTENRTDPLPGDLVRETILEDSLRQIRKEKVQSNMEKVLAEYKSRSSNLTFNGYFITDFDDDLMPELWVKSGTNRENSRLELYYPRPDGSLQKSEVKAEPGKYYLGEKYLIQMVGSGPGRLNVNRVSIHNGEMDVVKLMEMDIYSNSKNQMPKFEEREIRNTSLANLSTLYSAFAP